MTHTCPTPQARFSAPPNSTTPNHHQNIRVSLWATDRPILLLIEDAVVVVPGRKEAHRQRRPAEWIAAPPSKITFEHRHQHGHRIDQLARNKNIPAIKGDQDLPNVDEQVPQPPRSINPSPRGGDGQPLPRYSSKRPHPLAGFTYHWIRRFLAFDLLSPYFGEFLLLLPPPYLVAVVGPPSTTKRKHFCYSFPVFKPSHPRTSCFLDCFLSTTHTLQIIQTWARAGDFSLPSTLSTPAQTHSSHTDITSNSFQPPLPLPLSHTSLHHGALVFDLGSHSSLSHTLTNSGYHLKSNSYPFPSFATISEVERP